MSLNRFSLAAAALALMLPILTTAADKPDAVLGSWKLDVAKSTFAGAAPKSETRTYEAAADGATKLTTKSESASGEQQSTEVTYKYDGKDYPITGSKLFNAVSVTRVDSHTAKSELKLDGKTVGHFHRVVSHDGKTLTATTKLTGPKGEAVSEKRIYEKQ